MISSELKVYCYCLAYLTNKLLRMKKLSVIFLFLLGSYFSMAQDITKELDSLKKHIQSLTAVDTTVINLRNDYIKQALFSNLSDSTLLNFAEITLTESKKINYKKGEALAYERMALVYQYSFSNPFKALEFYHFALETIGDNKELETFKWGILGNIATIYYEQEEYRKALINFNKILRENNKMELSCLANIANIYGALKMNDSSIFFYKRALNHPQLKGNFVYEANLLSNISLIYQQIGNSDEALKTIEKSLKLIDSFNIEFVRPTAYANASMVYLSHKKYDKAQQYALSALEYSEHSGNVFMQKSAWGTLADLFEEKSEYELAINALKKHNILKDSLNNQNRRVEINRKQMEFDFDKKRTLADVELKRQKILKKSSIIAGSGLLLLSFIGFVMYKRKKEAISKQKEAEFKTLVIETELKALRAQLNPHFIFNSLNSIGDYFERHNNAEAQEYLAQFSKLMRLVLEYSEQSKISLSEDLSFVELYLSIETKRLPGKFNYAINIAKDLEPENIIVPPLFIQPFIENSIWHAFKSNHKQGHISVEIKKENNLLLCVVEDDGNGRNPSTLSKKSFGIAITESRLNILSHNAPAKGSIEIIDKPNNNGIRVEVRLPLEYHF